MLQRGAPVPMAQAEKAAVLSALTLMMTSGLPGAAAPQCTVASAATPSGDAGSRAAQEAARQYWIALLGRTDWSPHTVLSAAQDRQYLELYASQGQNDALAERFS